MVKKVVGLLIIGIVLGIGISYLLLRFGGVYSQSEPSSSLEDESTLHKEPVETSYSFETHGIAITLLNSGKLNKGEFQAFKEEFDYQVDEVLHLTEDTLPLRKELKFDITKDPAMSNNRVFYFDDELMADEQFYYFQIVSNLFEQDGNTRGRLTSAGLTGYLAKSLWGRPVHEEYSAYIGFEQAPGMVELLDPYEFSANYFVTFEGDELDNTLSKETEAKTFSFISYLIDTYGIKKFMEIYGNTNLTTAIEKIYQKTPEALEKEWLDFLGDKQSLGV
ncbi:hypothetical protein A8F94_07470 [Bacillus sp. FJAT-27225]|uniref:hypothetical protein n=1 Tax=Bacillus sp. FJAT-27225 TaxID=1743144 RepID=UPI00080C31F9|nr:hypothetical protein [Bacillus sp. FJAT-27225]OCA87686.1 hypothetical protein A8F94_07470 [Bacillus sp. FJAT-27225]